MSIVGGKKRAEKKITQGERNHCVSLSSSHRLFTKLGHVFLPVIYLDLLFLSLHPPHAHVCGLPCSVELLLSFHLRWDPGIKRGFWGKHFYHSLPLSHLSALFVYVVIGIAVQADSTVP